MVSAVEAHDGNNGTVSDQRPIGDREVGFLRHFVVGLEAKKEEFGPFFLPIQDKEGQDTGGIMLIAPAVTGGQQRPVATFVIIDPMSGIWGITFNRKSRHEPDKGDESNLQAAINSHVRSQTKIPGRITVTANKGAVIELAQATYYAKESTGHAVVGNVTKEQAQIATRASIDAAEKFLTGEAFWLEKDIARAVADEIDSSTS